MSMRELFKERLEKKFGIKLTPETEWEVFDKELVIRLGDSLIRIDDPQIVREAKAAVGEEGSHFLEEEMVTRMYAILSAYPRIQIPFSEFKKSYERMSKEEIMKELTRLEKEYIESKNITLEKFGNDMLIFLQVYSLKKGSSIPAGLSYKELPYTTQELAEIIARVSEKKRFSLGEELGIYEETYSDDWL